jgi:hypothetical protein
VNDGAHHDEQMANAAACVQVNRVAAKLKRTMSYTMAWEDLARIILGRKREEDRQGSATVERSACRDEINSARGEQRDTERRPTGY